VHVATGDSYSDPPAPTSDSLLAFDLGSGTMRWTHQATEGDAFNIACNAQDKTNCPVANSRHEAGRLIPEALPWPAESC
jgi:polyvinyl alcohol dehydrogenase (cytochrome)